MKRNPESAVATKLRAAPNQAPDNKHARPQSARQVVPGKRAVTTTRAVHPSEEALVIQFDGERHDAHGFTPHILLTALDVPLFIRRDLVGMTGSITAALMLTYAIHLYDGHDAIVDPDGDGWFHLSIVLWQRETGMTRHEQATARRTLQDLGFIEEVRTGMPARIFTRVVFDAIERAIQTMQGRGQSATGDRCQRRA
ncbi:hypothetical protein [Ralstonia sp. 1138]|uniref:hypothetical protein n=1 Tax=Ralstonia sp. 1138 TaxID=3156423 RepID=UPI003397D5BC